MAYAPGPMEIYVSNVNPILDGGQATFLLNELSRIQDVFKSTQEMIPQASTKAPTTPKDGMIRLARAPWRPVAGQNVDQWVFYDGASNQWTYLMNTPTNTGIS